MRWAKAASMTSSLTAWTVPFPPPRENRLPVVPDSEMNATVGPSIPACAGGETHGWHDAQKMKILIVDDEPAMRSALQRALALERYEVELAVDGAEALDRLAVSPVDAIVL